MWGCFLMSGVKILHFLKDWWKSIPIHQNYIMALIATKRTKRNPKDVIPISQNSCLYFKQKIQKKTFSGHNGAKVRNKSTSNKPFTFHHDKENHGAEQEITDQNINISEYWDIILPSDICNPATICMTIKYSQEVSKRNGWFENWICEKYFQLINEHLSFNFYIEVSLEISSFFFF